MNESHINEEWEETLKEKVGAVQRGWGNATRDLIDFCRTLHLQALEQGRTEGSRGDYGRKMYMNGYKEALEQAITTAKNETFRLKAPHEIEREYYEKNTGWEQCQAAIVKELEALSKLREE